ncbi:MAG: phosphohydrolase [Firmicutes bacterium]|nr:phosphohydrolase [Bacillota bacterium]
MAKEEIIGEMKEVFGNDIRRVDHALKVLGYAEDIMAGEDVSEDMHNIITDAAVLHDIGIKEAERKYGSSAGPYQEKEGPPIAKAIMEKLKRPPGVIDRVCYIVGHHHTASRVDGLDFQILWEADLLVNIKGEGLDRDRKSLKSIVEKNFKTSTGKAIACSLFSL